MKKQRIISDIGKGGINSTFPLEEKIKEYEKGLDYTVDETGNVYTILTERLKGVIWPNDNYPYDESIVTIDRQKVVQEWRSKSHDDPNGWIHEYFRRRVSEGEKIVSPIDSSGKIQAIEGNGDKNLDDSGQNEPNKKENFTSHQQIPPRNK